MIRDAGYRCHACGHGLKPFYKGKMLWCERCKAKRRTPNQPALMAAWRWEEILAERQAVA